MAQEQIIEAQDLPPGRHAAASAPGVGGVDGGLQGARPGRLTLLSQERRGTGEKALAGVEQLSVPVAHILLGQGAKGTVGVQPGRASRVGQVERRRQRLDFRIVVGQPRQQGGEPQHLPGEVGMRSRQRRVGVGLGIGDLERRQHRIHPLGPGVAGRHLERHSGVGDLAPGANQTLGEGRFGDQEGARDLGRAQAADRAQGQGGARLHRYRRVAADEDQPQSLVGDGGVARHHVILRRRLWRQWLRPVGAGRGAATQTIQRAPPGHGIEPGRRVLRRGLRPRRLGFQASVGEGLLGQIQIAERGGQGGDDPAAVRPEGGFERRHAVPSSTGRISMAPAPASGSLRAQAIASSRSAASIR